MAASWWLLVLLLGCAPGDSDTTDTADDTGSDTVDTDTADTGADTGGAQEQTFEHTCSGTASYSFTWPVQVDVGEAPPDVTIWWLYRASYIESSPQVPAQAATLGRDVGVTEDGHLIGSCMWYAPKSDFAWDLKLIVR